jgi:cob(I)alamin adenosyltransferase
MPKYYSKKGDQGSTGLLGKSRVPKSHPRIQAVGAIDEASAALGMARALAEDQELIDLVVKLQLDLYQIMSLIVLEDPDHEKIPDLPAARITWLEDQIERYQKSITHPEGFILPGSTRLSAALSISRAIIRRAEREVVQLSENVSLHSKTILPYLNRLSSLIFVLELYSSQGYLKADEVQ